MVEPQKRDSRRGRRGQGSSASGSSRTTGTGTGTTSATASGSKRLRDQGTDPPTTRDPPPPAAKYSPQSPLGYPTLAAASRAPVLHRQAPPGKIAIPAIKPPASSSSSKDQKKGRTSHACDACRKAKAGCSGEQPCGRCGTTGAACIYGDGKRDKDKKKMFKLSMEATSLNQHISDVATALRRIRQDESMSPDDMRSALDVVIAMTPSLLYAISNEEKGSVDANADEPSEKRGSEELDDAAEVGSTGSLDVVNVDTDRDDTRATGHMGKASAVAWAKRTAEQVEESGRSVSALGASNLGFTSTTYHTEDTDVDHMEPGEVDMFKWPDPDIADEYVQSYFEHVHQTFPILDKTNFMHEYNNFARGTRNLTENQTIWLATSNAIFAISSVYAQVTKAESADHFHDHLTFCARAKGLCMDQGLLYQDASIKSLSALGLLSLYYMTTGRLNRAWTLCGLSIRQALTLGLHVRSEAMDLSDIGKEQRVRLWWSLYNLECSLNELTGRPTCISDADISTPLPVNLDIDNLKPGQSLYKHNIKNPPSGKFTAKERPSATYQMPVGVSRTLRYPFQGLELPITGATFFIYRTQLSIISHEIITQLYCAATIKEKWSDVQNVIRSIDNTMLKWRHSLPREFDINFEQWDKPDWTDPHTLDRLALALHFNSSRMILFRPCLCRFEGRLNGQSEESRIFNRNTVESCIRSARNTIAVMESVPQFSGLLFSVSPWWHILHYLCEALSILVLEIAYRSEHLPNEAAKILEDAKKAVNWLRMMSDRSISARKAWEIYDILVKNVAPIIRWSTYDMPNTAFVPPGYKWQRFSTRMSQFHSPTPSPLSESNLSQHSTRQYHQPTTDQTTSTSTWANTVNMPTYPFSASHPNDSYPTEIEAPNYMHPNMAYQHFSTIWGRRGPFDEPWQHMFHLTNAADDDAGGMQVDGYGSDILMGSSLEEEQFGKTEDEVEGRTPFLGFKGVV